MLLSTVSCSETFFLPALATPSPFTVAARYRIGIMYNQENYCTSCDTAFGIGGDCIWVSSLWFSSSEQHSGLALPTFAQGSNPGPSYVSNCFAAGQYVVCCCDAAAPNCNGVRGYFSVWVRGYAPTCQAVSGEGLWWNLGHSNRATPSSVFVVNSAGLLLSCTLQLQFNAGCMPCCEWSAADVACHIQSQLLPSR